MAPAKEEIVSIYELAITTTTLNGGARAGDNCGRSVSVLAHGFPQPPEERCSVFRTFEEIGRIVDL